MKKEFTAKTLDEAKAMAAAEFGVAAEEIDFDILEQLQLGFHALGAPFVGVVDNIHIIVEFENVASLRIVEFSNYLQKSVYRFVHVVADVQRLYALHQLGLYFRLLFNCVIFALRV